MKKLLLTLAGVTALLSSNAQNTFPMPSGNVGIGTTSPTRQLEIISGAGVGPLKVSGPNGYLLIDNVGSGESYYQANSFHRFLGNSGTPIMTLFNSGYIGVGTITPAYTLDIHTPGGGPQINVQAAATSNGSIAYSTALGSWALGVGVGTAQNVFNLVSGNSEVLRVTSSGNVGIGTASPNAPLEVNGNIRNSIPSQFVLTNSVDVISASSNANLFTSSANANVSIATGISTGNVKIGPSAGGIAVLGSGSGGYVGIGTSSPDQMLTVNGTVHSKEVKVDMNILPDYVFKPAYRLPKLKDIKEYIDKNHHLPETPTAEEAAKNGLNVGQSEAMLLKKVEELTLYLIQQQKINNALQAQINDLKRSKQLHSKITNPPVRSL